MSITKPKTKPQNPRFSSGPCTKYPGWTLDAIKDAPFGRSHRHGISLDKINAVIQKSKEILGMPKDYILAIVPASDTGAIELAMWSLLGPRGVDAMGWETFGKLWVIDVIEQLKISDARPFVADFGDLPDLSAVDTDRDVVFTWNGTTSGVKIPHAEWIKDDRKGLTLCDATSAVFAMEMPWEKLDVVTWSWQKVLGGEAAHGMLALSPRAVERLESYTPPWPMPKIFRIKGKDGKLFQEPFDGKTLNTPSMMAIEDCLAALKWAESIGGLPALLKRTNNNLERAKAWMAKTDWAAFLASDPSTVSNTSICFKIVDPWLTEKSPEEQKEVVKEVEKRLSKDDIAYEVANHTTAPASFRLWGGATVEADDLESALEWIDWAYRTIRAERQEKEQAA